MDLPPPFRKLTKEEYEKLSIKERVAYMRELVEHVRNFVKDVNQSIENRKKKEPSSE